jgi:hypothetical protein
MGDVSGSGESGPGSGPGRGKTSGSGLEKAGDEVIPVGGLAKQGRLPPKAFNWPNCGTAEHLTVPTKNLASGCGRRYGFLSGAGVFGSIIFDFSMGPGFSLGTKPPSGNFVSCSSSRDT